MRILFVGDVHGNLQWWRRVVEPAVDALDVDLVVPVGDFGYYGRPDDRRFIDAVARCKVPVMFCDGNHEDHGLLAADVAATGAALDRPVPLSGNLHYLPRGSTFAAAGATFVVCGGAVSIDREWRTPGIDWWLEEQITDNDLAAVAAAGRGHVLVCHDAPAGWDIPGLLPDWKLPDAWRKQRPACEEHRHRLREAYESVQPQLVVHGHYHSRYRLTVDEAWGRVAVEGLDCDGTGGALLCVDVDDGDVHASSVALRAA